MAPCGAAGTAGTAGTAVSSPCVVSLATDGLLPCERESCTFPSRHDWDAAEFVSADDPLCEDTIGLKYWHICYDCLLLSSSQQMVTLPLSTRYKHICHLRFLGGARVLF